MIRFKQDNLDSLVECLRDQPGFITAAIVPTGSGDALIERLHEEVGKLKIEVAAYQKGSVNLGARAAQLGQSRDDYVFILRLDDPRLFDSEDDAIQFWRELNYQREALGSGTVRTCFVLSEETERGLALIADDLWDWTTIFRFPEAVQVSVRTPADSEALVWPDDDNQTLPSEEDLTILRNQWQRARQAEMPRADFVESYAVPLFLALPELHDSEALQLWDHDLRDEDVVGGLPPEMSLLVAQKLMSLARPGDSEPHRQGLIQWALTTADKAVVVLKGKTTAHPETVFRLAAALSTSAKLYQDAGRFKVALSHIERCLDLLHRLGETDIRTGTIVKTHIKRQWALLFLLRARDNLGLPLFEQIESLRTMQSSNLDDDLRSNALGAALEISITESDQLVPRANASLFTSWLLSHGSQLKGPPFEQVLASDPIGYCRSLEALWLLAAYRWILRPHRIWKTLLVDALICEWAKNGPACTPIRKQLTGWVLHFMDVKAANDDENGKNEKAWAELQQIAIKVFGYRYEPDLLRVFCRYLSSLSEPDEDRLYLRHRASHHLGFMLRWSYQEQALLPLQEVVTNPESSSGEVEASKDLVAELWQVEPSNALCWKSKSKSKPKIEEESPHFEIAPQDQVPVYVHTLWNPEFSGRSEHRILRLQWLRTCPSDKDIALHALAARTNGMLSEVESIGKELLSLDRQLERTLGVSLLAWHPEGDQWLEPLVETDPSIWVRQHAEWAIAVCRRDRLGRQLYSEALRAESWLEQQALFEQLVPLALPTFLLWSTWDEEISELTESLSPRRKALLIDFRYQIKKRIKWTKIVGRDLEKYCRGEDISTHLESGEKGPPWLRVP